MWALLSSSCKDNTSNTVDSQKTHKPNKQTAYTANKKHVKVRSTLE